MSQHKVDDLTAERAALLVHQRLVLAPTREAKEDNLKVIADALKTSRQDALRESARAICPYCNDPNWPSVNQYGDHASPHTSSLFMCKAWKIHQLDRLASEGG